MHNRPSPDNSIRCSLSLAIPIVLDFITKHRTDTEVQEINRILPDYTLLGIVPGRIASHFVHIDSRNKGKKRTAEQRRAESERLKGIEPKAATKASKVWREKNGGSYWKNHPIPAEAKLHMKEAQQKRGIKVKVEYNDGRIDTFNTMLDAATELGIGVGSVSHYINAGKGNWHKKGFKIEKL